MRISFALGPTMSTNAGERRWHSSPPEARLLAVETDFANREGCSGAFACGSALVEKKIRLDKFAIVS